MHFRVQISPYHYGHLQIFISANGNNVFSASEVDSSNDTMPYVEKEILDLCTTEIEQKFREHKGTKVRVERYVYGDWLQYFEHSIFAGAINMIKDAEAKKKAAKEKTEMENRSLSDEENRLAVELFGINTNVPVRPRLVRSVL